MRHEGFEQYTSRWTEVGIKDRMNIDELVEWCFKRDSIHAFHVLIEEHLDATNVKIYRRRVALRFQNEEDAMMFALTLL